MNNTMPTMDQLRAQYALKSVESFAQLSPVDQIELRRYIIQLPALIRMNGLGQALAFYRSKGDQTNHLKVYGALSAWLCGDNAGKVFADERDVLKAITQADMFAYMAAQNEALALFEWLKKFAEALLIKSEDKN